MALQNNKIYNQDFIGIKTAWLLISIALSALEMLLPRIPILPWLKPGLGNIITILWIIRFGMRDALLFSFLRSWITGFYFGFSFTTFALSINGGIFSTAVMGFAWLILGRKKLIGTIGLGMIGAFAHNIGQLFTIYLLMTHNVYVFYQIPFMCGASLIFGALVGSSAFIFSKVIFTIKFHAISVVDNSKIIFSKTTKKNIFFSNCVFLGCIVLLFTKSLFLLSIFLFLTTLTVLLTSGFSVKNIFYPIRFWVFFLFIGVVYLFFSYGTRIDGIPLITHEGLHETSAQFLRLWIWLEAGLLLNFFKFHTFFFSTLKVFFPAHLATLSAGLLSMEYFPEIVCFSKDNKNRKGINFFKAPVSSMHIFLNRLICKIEELLNKNYLPLQ